MRDGEPSKRQWRLICQGRRGYIEPAFRQAIHCQGCQLSDFSLISGFLRIKKSGIKLIKYGQNMDTISIVSKDRPHSGKGLHYPSLRTVSKH